MKGINITNNNFTSIGAKRSICAWIRPKGNHYHYTGAIVSSGNWNSNNWAFGVNQANTGFTGFDGGYSSYVSATIPVNEWTHLCVTVDNGTSRFYKNGVLIDTKSRGSGTLVSDASNTMIGRETYAGGYFSFNGDINDVRIYDHCLSKMEVKEISKALVLHYPLNDPYIESYTNSANLNVTETVYNGATGVYGYGQSYIYRDLYDDADGTHIAKVYCNTSGASINPYISILDFNPALTAGSSKTLSFDIYPHSPARSTSNLYFYSYRSGSWNYKLTNVTTDQTVYMNGSTSGPAVNILQDTWNHIVMTLTSAATNSDTGWQWMPLNGGTWTSAGNEYWLFKNAQITVTNSEKPYILPSQSNTARTIMFDTSGFKNNGTINGVLVSTNDTQRYDCSTKFDAVGISTNYTNYGLDVFTYSAWVKLTAYHSERSCISIGGTYFTIDVGGRLSGYAYGKSSEGYHTGSTIIPLNTWAHVALVWTTTQLIGYVNGVQDFAVNCTGNFSSSNPHCIGSEGANKSSRKITGMISDLREYATALSADDIKDLYSQAGYIDKFGNVNSYMNKEDASVMIKKNGVLSSNHIMEYGASRMKTLSDGSIWVLLLHHNNPASYLFTSSNCWNHNDGSNLYSALHLLKNNFWMNSSGAYEFLVCEKLTSSSSEQQVRWKQTSNPALSSTLSGYTLISGSPGRSVGLMNKGTHGCFHNGDSWWCCCGSYDPYSGGIPGFYNTVTTGYLDLYVRYPDSTMKGVSENQASFYKDNSILGNQFIEI